MSRAKRFTADEDAAIRVLLARGWKVARIAAELGRSRVAVYARIKRMREAEE